jgi:hypothetical protein
VRALLDDPSHRTVARLIADEIAAVPSPSQAMALIERLVESRAPIT